MPVPAPHPDARAVVTGASSGIGKAFAYELAAQGYSLIIVARRAELLNEIKADLEAKYGVTVEVRAINLGDRDARAPLTAELAEREISILINNAGVATFGPLKSLDPAYERTVMELNIVAPHDLTLAVLPQMLARKSGGLLYVGSIAGNQPIPNSATYAGSKAGINNFAESIRRELMADGVHVTLLAPGATKTVEISEAEENFLHKAVPDFVWSTSESTAKESLEALAKNKMRIVPGPIGKTLAFIGGNAPRRWIAPVTGFLWGKMAETQ